MKIALIGLPQVGKKTLFSLMTGMPYDQLTARPGDYSVGMVKVTDPRVDKLIALYKPKKSKYAEIECTLAPAPPKDAKPREQWLGKLKDMDALCHVVRGFEDAAVFHASGSVDPLRDIEVMNLELAITDLSLVELRLDRIAQEKKKSTARRSGATSAEPYLESVKAFARHRAECDLKNIRSLQFLTLKACDRAELRESTFRTRSCCSTQSRITGPGNEVGTLSAKVEAEVAQIAPPDRASFWRPRHAEPAVFILTRLL